jgi:hypothetical protein
LFLNSDSIPVSQKADALNALLDVIQRGIDLRGFFLLTDDRIKVICGDGWDDPFLRFAVANVFAEQHRWRAQTYGKKIIFWPIARAHPQQSKLDEDQSMTTKLPSPKTGKLTIPAKNKRVVFETNLADSHRNPFTLGPSTAFLGDDITDLEDRCAAIHRRRAQFLAACS